MERRREREEEERERKVNTKREELTNNTLRAPTLLFRGIRADRDECETAA
jgi:hypothetical protein